MTLDSGMTFTTGSSLEVQTPENIEDMALKTDVAFYANISNRHAQFSIHSVPSKTLDCQTLDTTNPRQANTKNDQP